ncbi:MAG: NUDIX domain-containing protein [Candidatus Micrarchaeia archaeon]|jgi:8-oxo-dGTP pyrophosphatase MutT (NUDIX family)
MHKAEKSCGIVVFSEDSGLRRYLILHYEEGHWDLPKGHVEKGETEEETARRETFEETGISELEFVPDFRKTISYSFKRKGRMVPKEVVFFLAKTSAKEVYLSDEHVGYAWLPYLQAAEKVTYENARLILWEAEDKLSKL